MATANLPDRFRSPFGVPSAWRGHASQPRAAQNQRGEAGSGQSGLNGSQQAFGKRSRGLAFARQNVQQDRGRSSHQAVLGVRLSARRPAVPPSF
jgi:hypothetical protein